MNNLGAGDRAKDLAETLRALYGDLLDLPLLSPVSAPAPTAGTPSPTLASFAEEIRYCQHCVLHIGREKMVFGRGSVDARVVFVGDFPSTADDKKGEPFSDEAGALLQKMILAMKLRPEEVYLTNLYKCRPPAGQGLGTQLAQACERHLIRQFEWLRHASFVVAMGEAAAQPLARSESPLPVLRRQVFDWNGRSVFCTHHPRDLLTAAGKKKEAWDDLQSVMRAMEGQ